MRKARTHAELGGDRQLVALPGCEIAEYVLGIAGAVEAGNVVMTDAGIERHVEQAPGLATRPASDERTAAIAETRRRELGHTRVRSVSATRRHNASIVNVGLEMPPVGNTEQLAT